MKRWQDRGEVADSDSEDLGFSNDSQSPERARKRQRIADESRSETARGCSPGKSRRSAAVEDEAPEDLWLQPKVATTYARKTIRPERHDPAPLDAATQTQIRRVESVRIIVPSGPDVPLRAGPAESQSQSPPDSDDELPNLSQILVKRKPGRPQTPVNDVAAIASARSSPLSELDDSPPPPDVFIFGEPTATDTSRPESVRNVDQSELDDDAAIAAQLEGSARAAALAGGRTFRARKEKQLHPYAWDKSLYQQQWKQRGLKPVHFTTADRQAPETQDESYSGDDSDSQEQRADGRGIAARPSPELGGYVATKSSDHEASSPTVDNGFTDVDAFLGRRLQGVVVNGRKRQKVKHVQIHTSTGAADTTPATLADIDEYSIPPSPPPTSSDSMQRLEDAAALAGFRTLPSGFRLPLSTAQAPLPTPQVSSEARPSHATRNVRQLSSESTPVRPRAPTGARALPDTVTIDSSTESEAEPTVAPELEDKRLRRVQKRIRGVLPASWLKIDIKSRQRQSSTSPVRPRRLSATSPPPTMVPQKGLAQRVSKSSATPGQRVALRLSDDEDPSDNEGLAHAASPSGRRELDRTLFRDDADDDGMEVNWIDPMLAGNSRGSRAISNGKKRQPRITDGFRSAADLGPDFSEERRNSRHRSAYMATEGRKRRAPRAKTREPRARSSRPPAPRLSVLDRPTLSQDSSSSTPQFLRVAQRAVRKRPDRGRHTPSGKVIRLATKDDTDEALAVLTAWREGTILPRSSDDSGEHYVNPNSMLQEDDDERLRVDTERRRHPLAEITNLQQQRLPSPLRNVPALPRSKQAARQMPRIRQTGLRPVVLRRNVAPAIEPSLPVPAPAHEEAPKRRRKDVQPRNERYRGAQLESLENTYDQDHRAAAFERQMNCLTENIARPLRGAASRTSPLDRLVVPPSVGVHTKDGITQHDGHVGTRVAANPFALARRPRKYRPQHIDVEARQYRQPSEPLPDSTASIEEASTHTEATGPVLHGLGPFGTRYATDFDIRPLQLGTYFHQSTFIGSGDFSLSLKLTDRDLTSITGRHIRIHVAGDVFDWATWCEDVATGLGRIPQAIDEALETLNDISVDTPLHEQLAVVTANVEHMLRSVVRYCSNCLTFEDAVDRRPCVQHLHHLVESLLDTSSVHDTGAEAYRKLRTRCLQYALVLVTQTTLLCDNNLIGFELKQRNESLVTLAAESLTRHVIPTACRELRHFYEENQQSAKREAGIRDDDTAVSAIVLLRHCAARLDLPQCQLWSLLAKVWPQDVSNVDNVSALEKAWYDLFTILPVLEMDDLGLARPGSRLQSAAYDWSLPKALTARALQLYPATIFVHGSSLNDYIRATITRSFNLAARWGWSSCEAILSTIFDFYAQRNFTPLDKEESRGSPHFLDCLETGPSLEVQPEDRSFTLFLKLLALALQNMRKYSVYSDRKIGSIAWRCIPSHGRTYPKEADIEQSDMDALRSHHDLLCTLYYSAPPGHRPRVDLMRNLVDHSTSHREACRLNVRAWTNIASFQASTHEPLEALQPLTAWFESMLHTTNVQFRLAKTEAERDYAIAKAQGVGGITEALLTTTIATNQRSIAATLIDALAGLKRALLAAKDLVTAGALIEGCAFWKAFLPFDSGEKRLIPALSEALEVANTALSVQQKLSKAAESQVVSEESQDYGDSSALLEFAATEGADVTALHAPSIFQYLHEPVAQLVSNVFGANLSIDDHVLERIVDTWVLVAQESVHQCSRGWSSFVDDYSPDSWHQLRDTEQKRKFTPYFLARIVEAAGNQDHEVALHASTALLTSLVERTAMLKYQHLLLAAVLNNVDNDSLTNNLPFSRDKKDTLYKVSLTDLRERRLAVLSSMLSNMRNEVEETMYTRPHVLQQVRRRYTDMLRVLMQAMKANYLELQGNATTSEQSADPNVQGAYVTFVQHVVSFLQQYTTDICRVDPFFTDSAAFPLPATDPMYVVGRLKGYVPKLADANIRKQLAVFVHSVSTRAAVDGHQEYLVGQLRASMEGVLERGNASAPNLRHVLLTAIFPAYIEQALSTACSWILALPVLRVCTTTLQGLLYFTDLERDVSVSAVVDTLVAILASLHVPLQQGLAHPGLLQLSHVQAVLALVFEASSSMLTFVQHLHRLCHPVQHCLASLKEVVRSAREVESHLRGTHEDPWGDEATETGLTPVAIWNDTRAFTQKQLHEALESDWHASAGSYRVRRGNDWKEVAVQLGDEHEEQRRLLAAIESLCASYGVIMGGSARTRWRAGGSSRVGGVPV
ncbi:hypothetical protein LTR49_012078 [Elasticomyces elasticus]|nr:hypothetical protein LTR49_012078 [Elasticomyces elasticus]